jgi:hypothetical protein
MHILGSVWTPDAIAECLIPMGHPLYAILWSFVADYEKIECIEDCGPADVIGINSLEQFWDRVPEEYRAELNRFMATTDTQ